MDNTLIVLICVTLTYCAGKQIESSPIGNLPEPISLTTQISAELSTEAGYVAAPRPQPTSPSPAEGEEEIIVPGKDTAPVEDEPAREDYEDPLVYAEDSGYQEFNLSLPSTGNDYLAAPLLHALGLPPPNAFLQTILTTYTLPDGAAQIANMMSAVLQVDDNLIVSLIQNFGPDALKSQNLTMEELKAFLLYDDNELMSLLTKLISNAVKENSQDNFQPTENFPNPDFDERPNLKTHEKDSFSFPDADKVNSQMNFRSTGNLANLNFDDITYLKSLLEALSSSFEDNPNEDQTNLGMSPATIPLREQPSQMNFNTIPPQSQIRVIPNQGENLDTQTENFQFTGNLPSLDFNQRRVATHMREQPSQINFNTNPPQSQNQFIPNQGGNLNTQSTFPSSSQANPEFRQSPNANNLPQSPGGPARVQPQVPSTPNRIM